VREKEGDGGGKQGFRVLFLHVEALESELTNLSQQLLLFEQSTLIQASLSPEKTGVCSELWPQGGRDKRDVCPSICL